MSLATFKKKSLHTSSTATKISGKSSNLYWMYQGPYGNKNSTASTILLNGVIGPNGLSDNHFNATNSGFSINGPHVLTGLVGQHMLFSKSHTPFRGIYPKGYGGTNGKYPDGPANYVLNVRPDLNTGKQGSIIRPSVLSNKGMLERRFKWIHSGQYPNMWVQPVYTGNQTNTASQGAYIHNKMATNIVNYDVNNTKKYLTYYKNCTTTGCNAKPARGYSRGIQQSNAHYTKPLHIPKDASDYTLRVQRQCVNPTAKQKPFPYAVQTGTGILSGGITVSTGGNACNTSNFVLTPNV